MQTVTVPGGMWRLNRTLHIYIATRATRDVLDRIHQYCRCIDGLILPAIGKTKQQFKSRTELFIGSGHHDLMGALYDIRSHVEHLHENRYLESFDREVRLDLAKKDAIVEYIARKALARIISQEALWPNFGNTPALEKFWTLSPQERRAIWGDPIDPMSPVAGFNPKYLGDGYLGKTSRPAAIFIPGRQPVPQPTNSTGRPPHAPPRTAAAYASIGTSARGLPARLRGASRSGALGSQYRARPRGSHVGVEGAGCTGTGVRKGHKRSQPTDPPKASLASAPQPRPGLLRRQSCGCQNSG